MPHRLDAEEDMVRRICRIDRDRALLMVTAS
jgi:hypothetical protein